MAQARAPRVGSTPSAVKTKAQPGLVVGVDGETWTMRTDAITSKDLSDLRRATGLTSSDVFSAVAAGDIPLDVFGALVFLARRQTEGRWVNYVIATEGLTLGSDYTLEVEADDTPEDPDSPEA